MDFNDLLYGDIVVEFSVVSCGSNMSEIEFEVMYIIIGVFYFSNFYFDDVVCFLLVGILCILVIFVGYLFILLFGEIVLEMEKK